MQNEWKQSSPTAFLPVLMSNDFISTEIKSRDPPEQVSLASCKQVASLTAVKGRKGKDGPRG